MVVHPLRSYVAIPNNFPTLPLIFANLRMVLAENG